MRYLSRHIEHAWIDMMSNHNLILGGVTDLIARKEFVSSLQNVIELIFKQYLIDRNDHSILTWTSDATKKKTLWQRFIGKEIDTRSDEQIAFELETDLNSYFTSVPSRGNNKTIGFEKLIKKICKIIRERNPDFVKTNLKLLQKLRNNETHFYIDDTYLSFDEFKSLRDLIKDVYEYLESDMFLGFFGNPFKKNRNYLKYFDYNILTVNSYSDLVINSDTNNDILVELGDFSSVAPHGITIDYCEPDDIFAITYNLFQLNQLNDTIDLATKINQFELYRRLELMNENSMLSICDDGYLNIGPNGQPMPQYTFVSKK